MYETLLRLDTEGIEYYVEDKLFFLSFLNEEQKEKILIHFLSQNVYLREIRDDYTDDPECIIKLANKAGWEREKIVKFIINPKEDGWNMNSCVVSNYVDSILDKVSMEEKVKDIPKEMPKEEPKVIKFQEIREKMDERRKILTLEIFLSLSKEEIKETNLNGFLDSENEYNDYQIQTIVSAMIEKEVDLEKYINFFDSYQRRSVTLATLIDINGEKKDEKIEKCIKYLLEAIPNQD